MGGLLPTTQNVAPYADPRWDPLWRTAEELDFPLHFHAREGITVGGANLANDFTARATYEPDDEERDKCAWFEIGGNGNKDSYPYTDCWTRQR